MSRKHCLRNDQSGFTLIELILVTVIIAVLAGMVTLSLRGTATDAKIRAALGDIKTYQSAIDLYALEHNDQFPKTLDALVSGRKKYLRELNEDPWGNPYVYLVPGEHHADSFDIFSMGPDGARGTGDDVAPWLMPDEPAEE
jgi:general secretion pathway protein G